MSKVVSLPSGTIRQWLKPFDLSGVAPCEISIRYSKEKRRTPLVRRIEELRTRLRNKAKKNPAHYKDAKLNETFSVNIKKGDIINEEVRS